MNPNPKVEMVVSEEQQYQFHTGTSKFDLYLYGQERNGRLVFSLEYSTQLFKQETIDMYIKNFKEVVSQVAANKDVKLENISISYDIYDKKIDIPEIDFGF
jgi:non-ribosomal peptide synthetase component F